MNEMTYRRGETTPVYQGVAPTTGNMVKAATGSVLLLGALLLRGRPGLLLAAAGGGLIYSSRRRRHVKQRGPLGVEAHATITIDAPARELYDRWRRLEHLPAILAHVQAVVEHDPRRSTWTVEGPLGKRLQWDAEITVDEPGRRIAWRSLLGGDVDQEGEVTFRPAPGDRGTVVTVHMRYGPPGGKLGAAVAGLFGREPRQELREDLRRLKMFVETGEIATTLGQPAARRNKSGTAGKLARRAADAASIVRRPLQSQEVR